MISAEEDCTVSSPITSTEEMINSVAAEIEAIIQENAGIETNVAECTESVEPVEENAENQTDSVESRTVEAQTEALMPEQAVEEGFTFNSLPINISINEVITLSENLVESAEAENEGIVHEALIEENAVESIVQETNAAETITVEVILAEPEFPPIPALRDVQINESDGPRAKHLKQALRKALNNTIKSCSGEKLETCFPFNLKPIQMATIDATIVTALQSVIDSVQEPFETLIKKTDLVEKLNRVDEFIRSRAPEAKVVDSSTNESRFLTPQNLIDRKLYSSKLSALNQLEGYLSKLETENSQLSQELNSRQSEFADRLDRLKSSQQLLDVALDQISAVSMEDLETLVDKMNHQYQPGAIKMPSFNNV